MSGRQIVVVAIVILAVIGAIVALLVTGGSSPGTARAPFDDPAGDVEIGSGADAPTNTNLADIRAASVARSGNDIVFKATVATDIPRKTPGESFAVRWDISSSQQAYVLSASLDVGPSVTLAQPDASYQVSTVTDNFPGPGIELSGKTMIVTLNPDQIPNFPDVFQWALSTSLDGSPGDPSSAVAADKAPNEGGVDFRGGD